MMEVEKDFPKYQKNMCNIRSTNEVENTYESVSNCLIILI